MWAEDSVLTFLPELGQRLSFCFAMKGTYASPAIFLTMRVCGRGLLSSAWEALLTSASPTWCLADEKTTMGCLDE